jgi:hypothetical protein
VYYAQRAASVVSVEHDLAWYKVVQKRLKNRGLLVDYRLVSPVKDRRKHLYKDTWNAGRQGKAEGHRWSYETYAKLIEPMADMSLDLVCVDGRARQACLTHGAPKVKIGGYILLDNCKRRSYRATCDQLFRGGQEHKWKRTWMGGTTAWQRRRA